MSRRTVLRAMGLGGCVLGLPALEAMTSRSSVLHAEEGGTSFPKRLILFHFGNGAPMRDFTPASLGTGWPSTPLIEALGESISKVDVLTGLSTRGTHEGLTGNVHGLRLLASTTCAPGATSAGSNEVTGAGAPSVDQVLAQQVGSATPHSSLVVAALTRNDSVLEGRLSWSGINSPVAPTVDPSELFALLFASFEPTTAETEEVTRRRKSVLDYVGSSVTQLQQNLGAEDRARLDQHLTSIREIEKALDGPSLSCVPPNAPDAIGTGTVDLPSRTEALLRLITAALSCDSTRVVSFSLGPTGGGPAYEFLGLTQNDHDISHLDYIHDAAAHEAYLTMTRWKISRFGRLIELLSSTPEGDGTLLDHCVVVGFSEMSDGNGHRGDFLPVLVAGGGIGMGRHVAYPCTTDAMMNAVMGTGAYCSAAEDTQLGRLWLTALNACGAGVADFGNAGGHTLAELWA
jgi:hypothetical protein